MLRSRKTALLVILIIICSLLASCYPNGRPFSKIAYADSVVLKDMRGPGIYEIKDKAAIEAFIDMLNGCTYEKLDADDPESVFKQYEYYRTMIGDQAYYINEEVCEIYINPTVNSGREGRYKIVDFDKSIFDALISAASSPEPQQ